jgi:hypothetical protein
VPEDIKSNFIQLIRNTIPQDCRGIHYEGFTDNLSSYTYLNKEHFKNQAVAELCQARESHTSLFRHNNVGGKAKTKFYLDFILLFCCKTQQ